MEVYLIRGNPIVAVLCTAVFSIILIGFTIAAYVNEMQVSIPIVFLVCFISVFNYGWLFAFYLAYRKVNHAFMSPKKYQKAIKLNQKYLLNCERLKAALILVDEKYSKIDDDEVFNKTYELITELNSNK